MDTIDTLYLTGDLITEKLCGCKEAMPIIIQQMKEPGCNNATTITHIICVTMAVVTFLFILGWLIKPLIESCHKDKEKQKERKFQERENCIKLRQSYQSKLLEENKNDDKKKKLEEYISELNTRIDELNQELGLIKS